MSMEAIARIAGVMASSMTNNADLAGEAARQRTPDALAARQQGRLPSDRIARQQLRLKLLACPVVAQAKFVVPLRSSAQIRTKSKLTVAVSDVVVSAYSISSTMALTIVKRAIPSDISRLSKVRDELSFGAERN